jgi:hypothetical protein
VVEAYRAVAILPSDEQIGMQLYLERRRPAGGRDCCQCCYQHALLANQDWCLRSARPQVIPAVKQALHHKPSFVCIKSVSKQAENANLRLVGPRLLLRKCRAEPKGSSADVGLQSDCESAAAFEADIFPGRACRLLFGEMHAAGPEACGPWAVSACHSI